jgi:hypothetical protein
MQTKTKTKDEKKVFNDTRPKQDQETFSFSQKIVGSKGVRAQRECFACLSSISWQRQPLA